MKYKSTLVFFLKIYLLMHKIYKKIKKRCILCIPFTNYVFVCLLDSMVLQYLLVRYPLLNQSNSQGYYFRLRFHHNHFCSFRRSQVLLCSFPLYGKGVSSQVIIDLTERIIISRSGFITGICIVYVCLNVYFIFEWIICECVCCTSTKYCSNQ
jgi:hypothetical protein